MYQTLRGIAVMNTAPSLSLQLELDLPPPLRDWACLFCETVPSGWEREGGQLRQVAPVAESSSSVEFVMLAPKPPPPSFPSSDGAFLLGRTERIHRMKQTASGSASRSGSTTNSPSSVAPALTKFKLNMVIIEPFSGPVLRVWL